MFLFKWACKQFPVLVSTPVCPTHALGIPSSTLAALLLLRPSVTPRGAHVFPVPALRLVCPCALVGDDIQTDDPEVLAAIQSAKDSLKLKSDVALLDAVNAPLPLQLGTSHDPPLSLTRVDISALTLPGFFEKCLSGRFTMVPVAERGVGEEAECSCVCFARCRSVRQLSAWSSCFASALVLEPRRNVVPSPVARVVGCPDSFGCRAVVSCRYGLFAVESRRLITVPVAAGCYPCHCVPAVPGR